MSDLKAYLEDELDYYHPGRPGWRHPRTWDDNVMPLWEFPEGHALNIVNDALANRSPAKWLRGEMFQIQSRAWSEWRWVRGMKLARDDGHEPRYRRPIPDVLRRTVYERDGFACLHCGAQDGLSLDHIYPHSLGGKDVLENLQTLCRPCNSRKGARV